jgi:hypothetical protein
MSQKVTQNTALLVKSNQPKRQKKSFETSLPSTTVLERSESVHFVQCSAAITHSAKT